MQKIFYLPEAPTDFILAVIAEELGVVGVCALLFLYGLIAYAGLRAAKAARSLHSALIAVGVTSLIVSQALLNVFAVLGLAPLTGVPLPFVSYGSSSLIVMLAAMGLLLNVAAGGTAHVRAVPSRARGRTVADARKQAGWGREHSTEMIAIAAGGTAGHVVPALAVADALRAEGTRRSRSSAGRAPRPSSCPPRAIELHTISVEGLSRTNPAARRSCAPAHRPRGPACAGAPARAAPRRRARRRRLCRRPGRSRRADAAHPARAHRGRQPPRAGQPRARARSPGACAWRSRSPAATGTATA